jgi:hypothetical protein
VQRFNAKQNAVSSLANMTEVRLLEFNCCKDTYKANLERLVQVNFEDIDILDNVLPYFDRLEKTMKEILPSLRLYQAKSRWTFIRTMDWDDAVTCNCENHFTAYGILQVNNCLLLHIVMLIECNDK